MAVKNLTNPIFHVDDKNTGGPLVGGKVYVYEAGTTNALDVYKEQSLTNVWTQPITLDDYGNAKIWFNADAKVVVWDATETDNHYTFDNVSPVGGTSTISGDYNLVQNGSFESADGGVPSQWTITKNDPSVSIATDTTNVSHGKSALKFDGLTSFGGGNAVSSKFDVTADTLLAVSLDTMASNATTTNDCQVFWYKKDDTASTTPSTTLGLPAEGSYPTSMTGYSFLTPVPSDATRAEIKLTGIDSGGSNLDADCWFDNVFAVDNQAIAVGVVSSPVTYLKASAGATGVNPSIAAEGEADTGVEIKDSNGNEILINESVASAVNEITVTNAATGNSPSIDQSGADDVGIDIEGVTFKNGTINGISYDATPAFSAYRSANYTHTSGNAVQYDAENFDITSDYDTGTYRFTPSVAGKYAVFASVDVSSTTSGYYATILIRKNGTTVAQNDGIYALANNCAGNTSALIDMNGSTDYIEVTCSATGTLTLNGGATNRTGFHAFRVQA